jgi:hypothetical protein
MIGFGHQWKLVRDWICSGCATRATHWLAIFASSSSMVAMCLFTIGSSTTDHRVSAGPSRIIEHEQDDAAHTCFGFARKVWSKAAKIPSPHRLKDTTRSSLDFISSTMILPAVMSTLNLPPLSSFPEMLA